MKSISGRVEELISPYLATKGLRIYDLYYVKEGRDRFLRLFIDRPGGLVSIDDCEEVSRYLSELLDREDFIAEEYILEVSSPGIERKLKYNWHFEEAIGKTVEIKLFQKINQQKSLIGSLLSGSEKGDVTISVLGDTVIIPRENIVEVTIYFDFGGKEQG